MYCFDQARSFSSSATARAMVKPPIQVFGLEGRYASALYSAAHKMQALEVVEKELKDFQDLISKDERLAEFIANPILKKGLKADALASVAEKTNMTSLSSNLLQMLAENGRLNRLDAIINAFKSIMSAYRGEVPCQVTSAKPLDEESLKEVEAAMAGFLQEGQSLQMTTKVDPSILGGLVVVIGDRYVDLSLATKIQRYSQLLGQAV